MKRICLLAALLFLTGFACAEYWDASVPQPAVCCDDRPGCQVLQTVMMGGFADFDPEDSLNVRVLSAALPRLTAVTEDDFSHFSVNFAVDIDTVEELYFIALGNCLRSDMIVTPLCDNMDEQNARTVLGLFLDPSGENAAEQMAAIRGNISEEVIMLLAENAAVPAGFVEYLLGEPETEQAP